MIDIKKPFQRLPKKDDLNNSLWMSVDNKKIQRSNYNNIRIGLFNVPCGGFGDIIVTKTFHDYLKEWYPTANVSICTTGPQKYKDLGLKNTKFIIWSVKMVLHGTMENVVDIMN